MDFSLSEEDDKLAAGAARPRPRVTKRARNAPRFDADGFAIPAKPAPRREKRAKVDDDAEYQPQSVEEALGLGTDRTKKFFNGDGSLRESTAQRIERAVAIAQSQSRAEEEARETPDAATSPLSSTTASAPTRAQLGARVRARRAQLAARRHRGARQQPGALSMRRFLKRQLRSDYAAEAERIEGLRVHQKWEYPLVEQWGAVGGAAASVAEGDKRVQDVEDALSYLDTQGFERSKQQRIMHTAMIVLSLDSYYGDELDQHIVRLLRKYNLSELRTEGVFLAPRRFGKSVSVAMFAAAELVTQPTRERGKIGHDVLIYSNNHRASSMLLMMIHGMVAILVDNPRFGGRIVQLNKKESLEVETRFGSRNQLFAYPADEDRLRGTGSKACTNTTIAEEFAYMKPDLLFKIIGPTLTRRGVKFIGITTVKGNDSFVSPLAEATWPDGRRIMLVLNFELVCDQCKREGRAHLCKCKAADVPPWQKSTQHTKLRHLMGDGQIAAYMQEMRGVSIEETTSSAFAAHSVEWLRVDESIMPTPSLYADTIYTAVDPACGGKYSKFAIVSAIFYDNKFVIVGIDSCRSDRPENQEKKLVAHLRAVRSISGLQTARIVFCPESNLASEGKRITADLARAGVDECYVLREDVRGNEGVRTTEHLKKDMWISFNRLLNERQVRWHPHLACVGSPLNDEMNERYDAQKMRAMVIDELLAYQHIIEPNKDPDKPPHEKFSGKLSGCDDHCIAVQLCYKAVEIWLNNQDFYSNLKPIFRARGGLV